MRLIVQIPALNEDRTIADVIRSIPATIPGVDEIRVLVVDDGSTDRTSELARAAGAEVIRHPERQGVGAAFRTGINRAMDLCADVVVTIDADGQFNPADIPEVIRPIVENRADFVTASRFMDPARAPRMPKAKRWGNDFIARWISGLVNQKFYDVSCGFRAYNRNAFLRLVLLGDFTYTHETFLSLAFARVRICEVPMLVRGVREHGTSRIASNLFRYGARTATIILKTYRDYQPLRFFGWIATVCLVPALGLGAFLLWWWATTGGFSPHKWAGFASATLLGLAMATFLVGVVAEMLDRLRIAQDELVFRVRRLEMKESGVESRDATTAS
ncbi:MAG: glycosyltransferase family 2 protein [Kiritimatiellae bacterium]|nr:glycosyltransferase family 2 protein [Kiritimatiellia bacterium]